MKQSPISAMTFEAMEFLVHFDNLTRKSKALMDSFACAPELFEQRFGRRTAIELMVPEQTTGGTILVSTLALPTEPIQTGTRLITAANAPQKWQILVNGAPIAEKVLADRAEWTLKDEHKGIAPQDGGWDFTRAASDMFFSPEADPRMRGLISKVMKNSSSAIDALSNQALEEDYVARAQAERTARLGFAFVKGKAQQSSVPGVDMDGLMKRLSKGPSA